MNDHEDINFAIRLHLITGGGEVSATCRLTTQEGIDRLIEALKIIKVLVWSETPKPSPAPTVES